MDPSDGCTLRFTGRLADVASFLNSLGGISSSHNSRCTIYGETDQELYYILPVLCRRRMSPQAVVHLAECCEVPVNRLFIMLLEQMMDRRDRCSGAADSNLEH